MEIIYYIIDDGECVRVDKSMYDNWNGISILNLVLL